MGKIKERDFRKYVAFYSVGMTLVLLVFFAVGVVSHRRTKLNPIIKGELQSLSDNSLVTYIYIGQDTVNGDRSIQLQDHFASIEDVAPFVEEEKKRKQITSLKVDDKVNEQQVTDVKQELRKVHALKIMYTNSN